MAFALATLLFAFLAGSVFAAEAVTFPAAVEVDLLFPRNDTYAPAALIPIVFAFQNAQLAAALDPTIQFFVVGASNSSDELAIGALDLKNANFSGNDPYYATAAISGLNGVEGQWFLNWRLSTSNCSDAPDNGVQTISPDNQGSRVVFSTKNGAQQPDLVAASASSVCAAAANESFTFNVTGTLNVTDPVAFDGQSTCVVLSTVQPTANPCGAAVNSAAAASISAAITSTACAAQSTAVTCPSSKKNPAARLMPVSGGWVLVYLALAGLGFHFFL